MDSKELKTSVGQRIVISIIAVLMLGSIVASYALIIANGNKEDSSSDIEVDTALVAELEAKYADVEARFKEKTKGDFETFSAYRSEVKAYNEATANGGGISTRDLKVGSGRELKEGDTNYYAYYIGWCADETVFDSSFDNPKNPTGFKSALDASMGLIEGWNLGVVGMKMDGIREVTISSELAYGATTEICGGLNKPLKFIIMAKEKTEELTGLANELEEASMRLQYAQYGIDYDEVKGVQ